MRRSPVPGDAPETLERYFQRLFQRLDRLIEKSEGPSQTFQRLLKLKQQLAVCQQSHQSDNLDALKWELSEHLPDLQNLL